MNRIKEELLMRTNSVTTKLISLLLCICMFSSMFTAAGNIIHASNIQFEEVIPSMEETLNSVQQDNAFLNGNYVDVFDYSQNITYGETIIAEDTQNRGKYHKEYVLSNGVRKLQIYTDAVHYENNGQWDEIDNTLTQKTSGINAPYVNTAGTWQVSLPSSLSLGSKVQITKDNYLLAFGLSRQSNSSPIPSLKSIATEPTFDMSAFANATKADISIHETNHKLDATAIYSNVANNIDIRYDLASERLKESVIIKSAPNTPQTYSFALITQNLTLVKQSDNSIYAYSSDTSKPEVVFVLPASYMIDAAHEESYDVAVTLTQTKDGYLLTYIPNHTWLADTTRRYPVILDPVVEADLNVLNIQDQQVCENVPDYSYKSSYIECGHHVTRGIERFYIRYKTLPELTAADVVVDASIEIYRPYTAELVSQVEVHKVLETWDVTTLQWANRPDFDPIIEDYQMVAASGWYEWSITDIVRGWYEGENTGMMFKLPDSIESLTESHNKTFYSSDSSAAYRPVLTIKYVNNSGLESYWDYSSHSSDRGGTGYINNFSGNLVWSHNSLGFTGNRMPVSINLVYNANDNTTNDSGIGYGWRTNYNQRISSVELDGNTYYIWIDEDATRHYFKYKETLTADDESQILVYEDESGLGLLLKIYANETYPYVISDKDDNTSHFDSNGRLRKIENFQATKSSINITYQSDSSNLISTIADGVGRVYTFTYPNNLLTKIAFKGTGTTEITSITYVHDGNSNLISATYKDNRSVTFGYEGTHLLSLVTNSDGTKIDYEYITIVDGLPNRIKSVRNLNSTGDECSSLLELEYSNNQTTLFDGENTMIMQFNDLGNTVSIQDSDGKAQFAEYALNSDDETSSEESEVKMQKNQLTLSSKLQSTVINLIKGSSVEDSTHWICYRTSSAGNTGSYGYSSTVKYMGNKSVYLTRTSDTGVYMIQQRVDSFITVEPGKTYTFSAYVKTTGMNNTGSGAVLIVESQSTGNPIVKSEAVKKNQDWTRYSVTYYANPTYDSNVIKVFVQNGTVGTAYFDCLQFEEGQSASRYNMLENGDFSFSGTTADTAYGWTESSTCEANDIRGQYDIDNAGKLDSYVYAIQGNSTLSKEVYQTIIMNGYPGDIFTLAGWAKGDSVPIKDGTRDFALTLTFTYLDGTTDTQYVRFNTDTDSNNHWQYAAGQIVAQQAYTAIKVAVLYKNNVNTVFFDGIQLYKEKLGYNYLYDNNGNIVKVSDVHDYHTSYEYEDNQLTKSILPTLAEETYTYDDYHNVATVTTEEGLNVSFTYDTYGNNTRVLLQGTVPDADGTARSMAIISYAGYTDDGNYIEYVLDPLLNQARYGYNLETGVLEWFRSPEDSSDTRVEYEYDSLYRLTDTTKAVSGLSGGLTEITNSYTYSNDLLTTIAHSNTEDLSTIYTFTYGIFDLLSSVKVGNKTLISHTYRPDSLGTEYELASSQYGNGDSIAYEYDEYDRVIAVTYDNHTNPDIEYEYNKDGNLSVVYDNMNDITTKYHYDTVDRLIVSENVTEDSLDYSFEYSYDILNNLSTFIEQYDGYRSEYRYTYDNDNRLVNIEYDYGDLQIDYDGLGRISKITKDYANPKVSEYYTYCDVGTSTSSNLITSMRSVTYLEMGISFNYSYSYDKNGNITSIIDTSSNAYNATYRTTYVYDDSNQLIRENNQKAGKTWVYTYDAGGNITQKKEYTYTTSNTLGTALDTITYTYGDSNWPDLLTAYDGVAYTTDAIGNLLNDGQWTYTWEHGRQLAGMTDGSTVLSFEYNTDGMRIEKTVSDETWTYLYHGSNLIYMTNGEDYLKFYYDTDRLLGFENSGEIYYYVFNLQGDIVGIVDDYGSLHVAYFYDAWGNIIHTYGESVDTIGEMNPFRYRGYYYDEETGLYYVGSRYYNPVVGRFINADAIMGVNKDLSTYNLFAYCGNNPVNRCDVSGTSWEIVISGTLHLGNDLAIAVGIDTAAIGAFFLMMKKDKDGVYHATFNCWQQLGGYNEFYDYVFDLGTSMEAHPFPFYYKGQGYTIWAWKGDYINLGAGAELGIYQGYSGHRTVDKSLAMWMSMIVSYNDECIITYFPADDQWWITGFNPKYQHVNAADLEVTIGVGFPSAGMYYAFKRSMDVDSGWYFVDFLWLAIFQF